MATQTTFSLSYLLCDPAPLLLERHETDLENAKSRSLLARAFLAVHPARVSDQNRLLVSSRHCPDNGFGPALSLPLPKGPDGRFLSWFEVNLVILPCQPVRIVVSDGADVDRPQAFVQVELVDGQLQVGETYQARVTVETLGLAEQADELPYISYLELGYPQEQASWLLQMGACLVHQGDPGDAFQVVCYLPTKQRYEYRFGFFQENSALVTYTREFEDLQDIEWH